MPTSIEPRRNGTRIIIGLAVVAAGILFTLDNLHVVEVERYLDYWPAVVILIGLVQMAQTRTGGGVIWSGVLIFGGSWMLAYNLDLVSVDIWKLSPLLLVALGASIIWRAYARPPAVGSAVAVPGPEPGSGKASVVGGRVGFGDSYFKGTAIMGGFDRASTSPDYRGADLVTIMGGCKLDLRRADIAADQAIIDVLVIMGGIELRIPENWFVDVAVTPLMGGVTDQTRPVRNDSMRRLVLRGTVFMGGVEIKN